ncbi:hypothetical protein P2B23_06100, partial [Xanthomonas perforans]
MAAVFATLLVARLRTAFLAALPDNVAASCEDFAVAADARLADALVTFLAGALPTLLAVFRVAFFTGVAAPARASGGRRGGAATPVKNATRKTASKVGKAPAK